MATSKRNAAKKVAPKKTERINYKKMYEDTLQIVAQLDEKNAGLVTANEGMSKRLNHAQEKCETLEKLLNAKNQPRSSTPEPALSPLQFADKVLRGMPKDPRSVRIIVHAIVHSIKESTEADLTEHSNAAKETQADATELSSTLENRSREYSTFCGDLKAII